MATGSGVNQGKGKFLEEFLPDNRDATLVEVNRAWGAAGHDGTISESLYGKIRSRLGLTNRSGSNGRATGEHASSRAKPKSSPKGAKGKAKKAEEAPPQPDLREEDKGPSRSAFVGEMLGREPGANLKKVNEAWASAGHEGTISPSIYYKIKRERGVTGTQSPGELASPGESQPEMSEAGFSVVLIEEAPQFIGTTGSPGVTASGDLGRVVDEVEVGIDELIFILKVNGGMPVVEAALRAARRLLTRSNGG